MTDDTTKEPNYLEEFSDREGRREALEYTLQIWPYIRPFEPNSRDVTKFAEDIRQYIDKGEIPKAK